MSIVVAALAVCTSAAPQPGLLAAAPLAVAPAAPVAYAAAPALAAYSAPLAVSSQVVSQRFHGLATAPIAAPFAAYTAPVAYSAPYAALPAAYPGLLY